DTCREGDAPAPVRAHRGTTSLAVGASGYCCLLLRLGGRSLAGCDGPDPPGSNEALVVSDCSSGGSPVIAGSSPCPLSVWVRVTTGRPNIFRVLFDLAAACSL